MYIDTYQRMHACMYLSTYVCMYVCLYICTYIHTYIYHLAKLYYDYLKQSDD